MQAALKKSDTSMRNYVLLVRFQSPRLTRGSSIGRAIVCKTGFDPYLLANMGVKWFRQVVKDTEITGMIPPYGSSKRTDEDNTYGELKAA